MRGGTRSWTPFGRNSGCACSARSGHVMGRAAPARAPRRRRVRRLWWRDAIVREGVARMRHQWAQRANGAGRPISVAVRCDALPRCRPVSTLGARDARAYVAWTRGMRHVAWTLGGADRGGGESDAMLTALHESSAWAADALPYRCARCDGRCARGSARLCAGARTRVRGTRRRACVGRALGLQPWV